MPSYWDPSFDICGLVNSQSYEPEGFLELRYSRTRR